MFCSQSKWIALSVITFSCYLIGVKEAAANTQNQKLQICLRNCGQCKEMYGKYFLGQLCADFCVKKNAKFILDCEDISHIAAFLDVDELS